MNERHALERYLVRALRAPVELLSLRPLKGALREEEDPKGFGYGAPLVNYLFFGLLKGEDRAEPFHRLFVKFFNVYLDETGDRELFEVLPPFYLFRAVVIAHPLWYPEIPDRVRISLLRFATAMGEPKPFDLSGPDAIFRGTR